MPDALIADATQTPLPVVEGRTSGILGRIAEKGVALAIWNRPGPKGLADWLDTLPAESLPKGRFIARPRDVPADLVALCERAGLDDSPPRATLIADVARLAERFARLAGTCCVDLRLEAIDHDSCWRFHRDHVGLRLNVTYRGPGTQWPPLDQEMRARRAQRRYRGPLNELPRFAAALFKGVPRAGVGSVLHRSPPVAARGLTRLFLCLNEEPNED